MNTHDLDPSFRSEQEEYRLKWEQENPPVPPERGSYPNFDQKHRPDPFLSDSEAFLEDDGFPPDVCHRCMFWIGSETAEFAYCPVVRLETAAETTCTRFEAKAEV